MYLKLYGFLTIEMCQVDLFWVLQHYTGTTDKTETWYAGFAILKELSAGGAKCQKTSSDWKSKFFIITYV